MKAITQFCDDALPHHLVTKLQFLNRQPMWEVAPDSVSRCRLLLSCVCEHFDLVLSLNAINAWPPVHQDNQEGIGLCRNPHIGALLVPLESLAKYYSMKSSLSQAFQPFINEIVGFVMIHYKSYEFYTMQMIVRLLLLREIYRLAQKCTTAVQLTENESPFILPMKSEQPTLLNRPMRQFLKKQKYREMVKTILTEVSHIIDYYKCEVVFLRTDGRDQREIKDLIDVLITNTTSAEEFSYIIHGLQLPEKYLPKTSIEKRVIRAVKKSKEDNAKEKQGPQRRSMTKKQVQSGEEQSSTPVCHVQVERSTGLKKNIILIQSGTLESRESEQKSKKVSLPERSSYKPQAEAVNLFDSYSSHPPTVHDAIKQSPAILNTKQEEVMQMERIEQIDVSLLVSKVQEQVDPISNVSPTKIIRDQDANSMPAQESIPAKESDNPYSTPVHSPNPHKREYKITSGTVDVAKNYHRFNFNRAVFKWKHHKSASRKTRVVYDVDSHSEASSANAPTFKQDITKKEDPNPKQ